MTIVFDLDDTIAPVGLPVPTEIIDGLRLLEREGHRIVVCSGKPVGYLCGMLRQIGLEQPIMIGENGAVIQFGVDLPPAVVRSLPYPEKAKKQLTIIKDWIDCNHPDSVWYQPNQSMLTPFPHSSELFAPLREYLALPEHADAGLLIYEHPDCFDIIPVGIDKGRGLDMLCEMLDITADDIIAVGNSSNDLPMLDYAGYSIAVGGFAPEQADITLPNAADAIEHIRHMA